MVFVLVYLNFYYGFPSVSDTQYDADVYIPLQKHEQI